MSVSLEQVDPRNLGVRLQEARKATGLTQLDVANQLGMARTTVVAIEKGERRITSHELVQLASLYRRSVSELVSKRVVAESLVPQFRASQKEVDPNFDQAAVELQARAEDYVELERLVGTPLARTFPSEYSTGSGARTHCGRSRNSRKKPPWYGRWTDRELAGATGK